LLEHSPPHSPLPTTSPKGPACSKTGREKKICLANNPVSRPKNLCSHPSGIKAVRRHNSER
jgi:hypothetical protein